MSSESDTWSRTCEKKQAETPPKGFHNKPAEYPWLSRIIRRIACHYCGSRLTVHPLGETQSWVRQCLWTGNEFYARVRVALIDENRMSCMPAIDITPITLVDRVWLADQAASLWGAEIVISRGVSHNCCELPGFIARMDDVLVGIATYHLNGDACELVTIDAFRPHVGAGSALLKAVEEVAADKRLWLITTNDNLDAIRFYQRRGFVLVAVHANAIIHSRQLKPQIPRVGCFGIEIRDELEFERAR